MFAIVIYMRFNFNQFINQIICIYDVIYTNNIIAPFFLNNNKLN